MDIQEKEALIAEIERFKEEALKMHTVQVLADTYKHSSLFDYSLDSDGSVIWYKAQARQLWDFWQAAQAVPEGFVLIKESERDREVCELIDQRDNMERLADQLKDKLQDLYKVDFGEYTSCNCPLKNAIEYGDSNLVLVPREPTEEMLGAAWEAPPAGGPSGNRRVFYEKQAVVYKAMVEEAEKEMIEAQEQKG